MGCSCSSSSAFRFKNFVVAVYPSDMENPVPNRDALGKLQSYVSSNPERIPRVCRKIMKLMQVDVAKGSGRNKRVSIGVRILRALIDEAMELETFVPFATSIAGLLLESPVLEHHLEAADLIAGLCYRIHERCQSTASHLILGGPMDQARRLVADASEKLSSGFRAMLAHGLGTSDVLALHGRFGALVALGNLALCSIPSIPDSVVLETIPLVVLNLMEFFAATNMTTVPTTSAPPHAKATPRRRSATAVTALQQTTQSRGDSLADPYGSYVPEDAFKPRRSVILPIGTNERDAALQSACLSTIVSLASTCTSSAVPSVLLAAASALTRRDGWVFPKGLAVVVYRAAAYALQEARQQPLGIHVCQHLCELADETAGTQRFPAVIRSLSACLPLIPMTGGRSQPIVEVIKSSLTSGLIFRAALLVGERSNATEVERNELVEQSCEVITELSNVLVSRVANQSGSAPQLGRLAVEIASVGSKITQKPLLCLWMEILLTIAPYVADVRGSASLPSVPSTSAMDSNSAHDETSSNNLNRSSPLIVPLVSPSARDNGSRRQLPVVLQVTLPFLGAGVGPDPALLAASSRVLCALIGQEHKAAVAGPDAPLRFFGLAAAPIEIKQTIQEAKLWIGKTMVCTDHSPQSVVAVTNVISTIAFRYRWDACLYVLSWIFYAQKSFLRTTVPSSSSLRQRVDSSADGTSPDSGDMITALDQAWIHAALVSLRSLGEYLEIPQLCGYVADVLQRRRNAEPCEIGMWFQPVIKSATPTDSGIRFVEGDRDTALAPLLVKKIKNLLNCSTVLSYILTSGEIKNRSTFLQALQLPADSDLPSVEEAFNTQLTIAIESPQPELESSGRRASNGDSLALPDTSGGGPLITTLTARSKSIPVSQSLTDFSSRDAASGLWLQSPSANGRGSFPSLSFARTQVDFSSCVQVHQGPSTQNSTGTVVNSAVEKSSGEKFHAVITVRANECAKNAALLQDVIQSCDPSCCPPAPRAVPTTKWGRNFSLHQLGAPVSSTPFSSLAATKLGGNSAYGLPSQDRAVQAVLSFFEM